MAGRAQVNRALRRFNQAQQDIGRAIALTPELDVELFQRAITHQLRGDIKGARADLEEAISIAESVYEVHPDNWRNTFNLALYYLAWGRRTLSERLYREGLDAPAPETEIRGAERSLQDYITLFPNNHAAKNMLKLVRSYLK
jgi:tetratricopeptide (TPR) repeat protein